MQDRQSANGVVPKHHSAALEVSDMCEMKHDPVEDTTAYKAIEEELKKQIEAEMAQKKCGWWEKQFVYWEIKRRILKEKYGIIWFPPPRWNPTLRW